MPTSAETFSGWDASGVTMNQLAVSILQAFGYPDETFGFEGDGVAQGPLVGLL
jgi:hypothetical protein